MRLARARILPTVSRCRQHRRRNLSLNAPLLVRIASSSMAASDHQSVDEKLRLIKRNLDVSSVPLILN